MAGAAVVTPVCADKYPGYAICNALQDHMS